VVTASVVVVVVTGSVVDGGNVVVDVEDVDEGLHAVATTTTEHRTVNLVRLFTGDHPRSAQPE
jgi:hypothetical protein